MYRRTRSALALRAWLKGADSMADQFEVQIMDAAWLWGVFNISPGSKRFRPAKAAKVSVQVLHGRCQLSLQQEALNRHQWWRAFMCWYDEEARKEGQESLPVHMRFFNQAAPFLAVVTCMMRVCACAYVCVSFSNLCRAAMRSIRL